MKKIIRLAAVMVAEALVFGFTACNYNSDDTSSGSNTQTEKSVSLNGSYAVIGSNFDETTAALLSSAKGSRCSASLSDETLPSGVKTVFIDWDSFKMIGNDIGGTLSIPVQNLDRLYNWTKQGATLVFHKPESWSTYTVLFHIKDRLAEMESTVGSLTTNASISNQNLARNASNENEFGEFEYDIVAIKPDASTYYLHDVYAAGKETTVSVETTKTTFTFNDQGEIVEETEPETQPETSETVTATEPSAEQYALCASEVVKWLNETKTESQARFATAARGAGISAEELFSQVCSETRTIMCEAYQYHICRELGYNPKTPLTLRVWTTCMYNFDKDEDYYHVLLEEEFDASSIYKGIVIEGDVIGKYKYAGFTWKDMDVRARFTPAGRGLILDFIDLITGNGIHNAYEVTSQWNVQPNGNAAPITTESIEGWSVGAEVSGSAKGLSGKLTGNYTSEKHVKTVENNVSVVNHTNVDGNWMQWEYSFAQQLKFGLKKFAKIIFTEPARDSASRSKTCQSQSWNWIVKTYGQYNSLKDRGDKPFTIDFKLEHMRAQSAFVNSGTTFGLFLEGWTSEDVCEMLPEAKAYQTKITLPVPERFKHIYSLTTDEVSDLSEFNNLMTALNNVSSSFNQLYAKLIRKDSEGNLCGRTGVTEDAVKNMVGKEWYALAHEVEGKKITVSKPYKFYVKDENGNKLSMVQYNNGNGKYEAIGTYLVIDTDGIKITNE